MSLSHSARAARLEVDGITVEVVRKRVKHVNLKVYPPDGQVRVSAPLRMSDGLVADAVRERIGWIHRHRARFAAVPLPDRLEYLSGETVSVLGTPHTLWFAVHAPEAGRVRLDSTDAADLPGVRVAPPQLTLLVPAHAGVAERRKALEARLRQIAKQRFTEEAERWSLTMGVQAPTVLVRRMRSRWGTCHVRAGKVYLNLALITRPQECLTYVVVHELAHLIVPDHSRRFWQTVERFLPTWRDGERRLGREPLWADPVWGDRNLSPRVP